MEDNRATAPVGVTSAVHCLLVGGRGWRVWASEQQPGLGSRRVGTAAADEAVGTGSPALAVGTAGKGRELRVQVQSVHAILG